MAIKNGDTVTVHYKGTFDDGTVFDSSEGKDPLTFTVGAKQVVTGFNDAVIGMEKGTTKKVHLKTTEAYGDVNPQLVQQVPKDKLPGEVSVDQILGITLPTGQQIPAKVVKVEEKTITIDLNHPLAGKELNFEITVEEVKSE